MAVCHSYSAHTQYMQSTKLRLPRRELTTTGSCNMRGVRQPALGSLRSCTEPLGSILIHCNSSLLCWCLSLFQAASIQSMLQGQDSTMVGPRKARCDNPVGQRRMSAVLHPDEMTGCRNAASQEVPEPSKVVMSTRDGDTKSLNTAGPYPVSPSSNFSGGRCGVWW